MASGDSLSSSAAIATTVSLFSAAARREEKWGEREEKKDSIELEEEGIMEISRQLLRIWEEKKLFCRPLGGGKEKVGDKYKSHSFLGGKGAQF